MPGQTEIDVCMRMILQVLTQFPFAATVGVLLAKASFFLHTISSLCTLPKQTGISDSDSPSDTIVGLLTQEGLWWLPLDVPHRNAVRKLLLLVALGAALGGLEGRVVFRAFGQYIWLQPPWSYVLVTLALYGSAALAILHFAGQSSLFLHALSWKSQ